MNSKMWCVPYVRVRDALKSAAYYQDCLGFTQEWTHQFEAGLPWCVCVARQGMKLMLTEHRGDGNFGIVLYCHVEDVEGLHAEFTAKGAKVQGPPESMPWGKDFFVIDLDGNHLRFGSGCAE